MVNRFKTDDRTKSLYRNIGFTTIYKFLNIVISLASVPILINILGTTDYGVWITISSLLSWMIFFDFGISINLSNKIARTIAQGKIKETKTIISSTYALIILLTIVALLILLPIIYYIEWNKILNIQPGRENLIKICLTIICVSVSTQIILKLINAILFAYQVVAIMELLNFIIQATTIVLTIAWLTIEPSIASLLGIAIIFSITPLIILLIFNIVKYKSKYKIISPSKKYVSKSLFKEILKSSSKFFVLQLYGLVLFQTDYLLAAAFFSPASVTVLNLATKYFNIITILFGIILLPLWSALAEAFALNDYSWIKNTLTKSLKIWLGGLIVGIAMVPPASFIISYWAQENITVPIQLSSIVAVYTLLLGYNNILGVLLNAGNYLKLQIIIISIIILCNVPLSIFLIKVLHAGLEGIVISNLICIMLYSVFMSVQVKKILDGKATGIWAV